MEGLLSLSLMNIFFNNYLVWMDLLVQSVRFSRRNLEVHLMNCSSHLYNTFRLIEVGIKNNPKSLYGYRERQIGEMYSQKSGNLNFHQDIKIECTKLIRG